MTVLAGALPLLALLSTWLVVAARVRAWRLGLVGAYVVVGAITLVGSELLSLAGALRTSSFVVLDVTVIAGCAVALARGPRLPSPAAARRLLTPWCGFLAVLLAGLTLLAVAAAPNNFDSMFYHLPKVERWAAAGSLATFATSSTPQVYLGPLAELQILHLDLLTRGDQLANTVQLLGFVVAVVGVSVIAANLGLPPRGQLAAAVVLAAAPMAVSQAVTTQNDEVTAAFVVAAVCFTTAPRAAAAAGRWAVPVAAALGLAAATKATAVLFALPVAVWFALRHAQGLRPRRLALSALLAVLCVVALNAGQSLRNQETFGSVAGPSQPPLRVERVTAATVVGNVVRDVGHNAALPGVTPVNAVVERGLRAAMGAARIDPDQPAAIVGADRFDLSASRNEDRASNPGQQALFVAALLGLLLVRPLRRQVGPLSAVVVAGFVLFAAVLRWQPYGGRLLLPLVALAAVPAAALLVRLPRALGTVALVALAVLSAPFVLVQQYRPLVGSDSVLRTDARQEYFRARPASPGDYAGASAYVRALPTSVDTRRVGLVGDGTEFEYPLWISLDDSSGPGHRRIRVVGVDVGNQTRRYESPDRPPVVICACRRTPPVPSTVRRFGQLQVEVAARP